LRILLMDKWQTANGRRAKSDFSCNNQRKARQP